MAKARAEAGDEYSMEQYVSWRLGLDARHVALAAKVRWLCAWGCEFGDPLRILEYSARLSPPPPQPPPEQWVKDHMSSAAKSMLGYELSRMDVLVHIPRDERALFIDEGKSRDGNGDGKAPIYAIPGGIIPTAQTKGAECSVYAMLHMTLLNPYFYPRVRAAVEERRARAIGVLMGPKALKALESKGAVAKKDRERTEGRVLQVARHKIRTALQSAADADAKREVGGGKGRDDDAALKARGPITPVDLPVCEADEDPFVWWERTMDILTTALSVPRTVDVAADLSPYIRAATRSHRAHAIGVLVELASLSLDSKYNGAEINANKVHEALYTANGEEEKGKEEKKGAALVIPGIKDPICLPTGATNDDPLAWWDLSTGLLMYALSLASGMARASGPVPERYDLMCGGAIGIKNKRQAAKGWLPFLKAELQIAPPRAPFFWVQIYTGQPILGMFPYLVAMDPPHKTETFRLCTVIYTASNFGGHFYSAMITKGGEKIVTMEALPEKLLRGAKLDREPPGLNESEILGLYMRSDVAPEFECEAPLAVDRF
jgi:hypothetical protein